MDERVVEVEFGSFPSLIMIHRGGRLEPPSPPGERKDDVEENRSIVDAREYRKVPRKQTGSYYSVHINFPMSLQKFVL